MVATAELAAQNVLDLQAIRYSLIRILKQLSGCDHDLIYTSFVIFLNVEVRIRSCFAHIRNVEIRMHDEHFFFFFP